jgi:hypothetical protein
MDLVAYYRWTTPLKKRNKLTLYCKYHLRFACLFAIIYLLTKQRELLMNHLTVSALNDIAQSQFCLYGNQALFVLGEGDENTNPDHVSFDVYVKEVHILECVSRDEASKDLCGLQDVAEQLGRLDAQRGDEIINVTNGATSLKNFRVGIKSKEDGFVELFNSTELEQQTIVQ